MSMLCALIVPALFPPMVHLVVVLADHALDR